MRVAATDDTTGHGPLAAPAGTGDDGRRDDDRDKAVEALAAAERRALSRELAALACAVTGAAIAVWSLLALGGLPAAGLFVAALLGVAARALGYGDPNRGASG